MSIFLINYKHIYPKLVRILVSASFDPIFRWFDKTYTQNHSHMKKQILNQRRRKGFWGTFVYLNFIVFPFPCQYWRVLTEGDFTNSVEKYDFVRCKKTHKFLGGKC